MSPFILNMLTMHAQFSYTCISSPNCSRMENLHTCIGGYVICVKFLIFISECLDFNFWSDTSFTIAGVFCNLVVLQIPSICQLKCQKLFPLPSFHFYFYLSLLSQITTNHNNLMFLKSQIMVWFQKTNIGSPDILLSQHMNLYILCYDPL